MDTGIMHFEQHWRDFRDRHDTWYREQSQANSVVYALPSHFTNLLARSLVLDSESIVAERDFEQICARFSAIAICCEQPIVCRWLQSSLPRLDRVIANTTLSPAEMEQAHDLIRRSNAVRERLKGAAGRLMSSHRFLQERDALEQEWQQLPGQVRPMPFLYRSTKVTTLPVGFSTSKASNTLSAFTQTFDKFCDRWRLIGISTWDLPEPDGPKWPNLLRASSDGQLGETVLDTPWHFPLKETDGVGQIARQEHDKVIEAMGIDDPNRWQAYAHLAEIDHWQRVIQQRYLQHRRPRGFITAMEGAIGSLVELDGERVQKYRKLLSSLKSGRRSSQAGSR